MRELTADISRVKLRTGIIWAALVLMIACRTWGQGPNEPNSAASGGVKAGVELARYENEFSTVRFEPARMDANFGLAVIFEGTDDLHYYAKPETAPAPGFELKVKAKSEYFDFGDAIFPKWKIITDPVGNKVEVYAGNFTVFLPITSAKANAEQVTADAKVTITGITCTSKLCLPPFEKTLQTQIDWSKRDSWSQISLEAMGDTGLPVPAAQRPVYSAWFALTLAFIAGLALNIMPCVWPVLPLIIMRIIEKAKSGRRQSVSMGLAFCIGILLFFACLAGANIILHGFYNRSLNWGDQLRNTTIVTALALLMIIMALFMFGIFTITVPSSIAGKSGSGKGYAGSVGMGFLAAILSTPCSFGLLTVAFVWAQGQPLFLGTLAIMVIGLGMAAPYAILTSMPGWLKGLPKSGRWMELFKQALGFVLLVVAVKLIKAVPAQNRINLLYFAVVLSFSIWMWGTWVSYGSKLSQKLLVRGVAVLLVILAFWFFFRPELVTWQGYDRSLIESAISRHRPVLIDFTADWCTNCEIVDKFVYERKDVAELIDEKDVLAIKGDTTKAGEPATIDLSTVYKEPGVPVTILFLPGKTEPVRMHGLFFADELKALLEKLPDKRDSQN
jgi:thiol:disulfide interchange protein